MQQVTREPQVEALPTAVPEHRRGHLVPRGGRHGARRGPAGDRRGDLPRRPGDGARELLDPARDHRARRGRGRRGRGGSRRRARAPPSRPPGCLRRGRRDRIGEFGASSGGERAEPDGFPRRRARQPRAASTRATGTTSAGWSSTSPRAGMADRSRASSVGGSPTCAWRTRGWPRARETHMNESGASIQAAAAFFKIPARAGARRPRRRRP